MQIPSSTKRKLILKTHCKQTWCTCSHSQHPFRHARGRLFRKSQIIKHKNNYSLSRHRRKCIRLRTTEEAYQRHASHPIQHSIFHHQHHCRHGIHPQNTEDKVGKTQQWHPPPPPPTSSSTELSTTAIIGTKPTRDSNRSLSTRHYNMNVTSMDTDPPLPPTLFSLPAHNPPFHQLQLHTTTTTTEATHDSENTTDHSPGLTGPPPARLGLTIAATSGTIQAGPRQGETCTHKAELAQ